jgi:hypothetical protein
MVVAMEEWLVLLKKMWPIDLVLFSSRGLSEGCSSQALLSVHLPLAFSFCHIHFCPSDSLEVLFHTHAFYLPVSDHGKSMPAMVKFKATFRWQIVTSTGIERKLLIA